MDTPSGLNGVCRTSNASSGGGTFCSCPYGFSQLNPYEDWVGCKPDFPLPNCDNGWEENKGQVSFVQLTIMDWPFTDYSLVQGANETECKQQCLDDCMCVVAITKKQVVIVGRSILCPTEDIAQILRE